VIVDATATVVVVVDDDDTKPQDLMYVDALFVVSYTLTLDNSLCAIVCA